MATSPITERVRQLILGAIDSVAELEALLLLRENSLVVWTPDAASARLYVSVAVVSYSLRVLAERGLVEDTGSGFRYRPASVELAEDVDALARAYSSHLIAVTHLIHGKPGPGVQDFARAFRLRKNP
jgi:hypothetical protein